MGPAIYLPYNLHGRKLYGPETAIRPKRHWLRPIKLLPFPTSGAAEAEAELSGAGEEATATAMAAAASRPSAPFLGADPAIHETSQTAYVSPLALLKILVHAARESPVSAMGVLLWKEVDGFSVRVSTPSPCRAAPSGSSPRPSTAATSTACSPCSSKPTGDEPALIFLGSCSWFFCLFSTSCLGGNW
ncbi:hypothetical protein E2562_024737 [Oryza meyeriana var. granulata]|uniref:Uncharacterized protein n=1 Tax=Oryza meyeriana var. granulata TaxID=110450 RepID=A0A6G1D978_9ORYZ|nr:hypothetical protein E2562_024737 [Oryza meyeriana var. granulata]